MDRTTGRVIRRIPTDHIGELAYTRPLGNVARRGVSASCEAPRI